MSRLRAIVFELYGLFVDDGSFAAAILIWLLVTSLITTHLKISPFAKGPFLLAGLAIILGESAYRRSRK